MRLSPRGLRLLSDFEGSILHAYNDSAGNATIGVGHLLHLGKVRPTDPKWITQAEADALLAADVALHEAAVNRVVRVPLTQHQFDALVSLSFNIGTGIDDKGRIGTRGFAPSSLVRYLNQSTKPAPGEVRRLFCLFCRSGGKPDKGLLGRRNSEATYFLTPDAGA